MCKIQTVCKLHIPCGITPALCVKLHTVCKITHCVSNYTLCVKWNTWWKKYSLCVKSHIMCEITRFHRGSFRVKYGKNSSHFKIFTLTPLVALATNMRYAQETHENTFRREAFFANSAIRDNYPDQIHWIFGKLPNGLWHLPPLFRKAMLRSLSGGPKICDEIFRIGVTPPHPSIKSSNHPTF